MVIVSNYRVHPLPSGKTFVTLELTGDLEMVQSQTTGKFYATVRKCTIPSTFDEAVASRIVGSQMHGSIERMPCVPYSYRVESGEEITLGYRWEYRPEGANEPASNEETLSEEEIQLIMAD